MLCSVSTPRRTPTAGGGAWGAFGSSGAHEAAEGRGPQDPSIEVTVDDRVPVPETAQVMDMTTVAGAVGSSVTSDADVGGPAASTGIMVGVPSSLPQAAATTTSANDADDQPEVIMRHVVTPQNSKFCNVTKIQ
jgi:hypothetical protein